MYEVLYVCACNIGLSNMSQTYEVLYNQTIG